MNDLRDVSGWRLRPVDLQIAPSTVEACPICDDKRWRPFDQGRRTRRDPGQRSDLVYLKEPAAARDFARYYPDDTYYAYRPAAGHVLFGEPGLPAALWYSFKRGVLAHEYHYAHWQGSRALARLSRLPLLRPLRRRATFHLAALLHPYVESGSLLDVGCGSGSYLDLMRALGWRRVVGVDLSAAAIERAKRELGVEAYCGELTQLGFEADSFDAASLSHSLEHMPRPLETLREVYRLLKPGGRLAVIVPNVESLLARRYGGDWLHLDLPRHLVHFTCRNLSLALTRAGFLVAQLQTTPRAAYETGLHSHRRQTGAAQQGAGRASQFALSERARARGLSIIERAQCLLGWPAGEEIIAVARKPRFESR